MRTELTFVLAAIATFLAWNVRALFWFFAARQAVREGGPDAVLPFRFREQKAKHVRVMAIAMLVASPIMFPLWLGFETFDPRAIARRADGPCRKLLPVERLREVTGRKMVLARIRDSGERCYATFEADEEYRTRIEVNMQRVSSSIVLSRETRFDGYAVRPIADLADGQLGEKGERHLLIFGTTIDVEIELGPAVTAEQVDGIVRLVIENRSEVDRMARR